MLRHLTGSCAARWALLILFGAVACIAARFSVAEEMAQTGPILTWDTVPPLPDPVGLAGVYAGVSNDALMVAGGANFPEAPPWDGGEKLWHDAIFVLTDPDSVWQQLGRLPRALAYGVSLTTDEGVICIGGGDANRHYTEVFRLEWTGESVNITELPPLPRPTAFMCGAILGNTIYVAGGREQPDSPGALKTFCSLDLSEKDAQWDELEPWPGRPRMLAVAAAQDGAFFVVSGVDLVHGDDDTVKREYLRDGYRYRPGEGWTRIADLPRAVAAAPTPAVSLGQTHFLVLGGDTGADVGKDLREGHPGFSPEILAYHTITDTWVMAGTLPKNPDASLWPPVTTTTTEWRGRIIVPSGEARPGIRTPQVLAASEVSRKSGFKPVDYIMLAVYLGALVWMGFYFAKREKSTDDFFLAGRRVPWWAAGLSIFGTQLSAITFMAIPAKTFATDWTYFMTNMGIVAVAPIVVFLYLPFYRRLNVTTAYEYLEKRFNVGVRLYGSAAFVLLQIGRMAVVLFLPAIALSAVTGINVYLCILLMGALATLYTALGGIEAVIWTDVLQVVVLAGGALLALATVSIDTGGVANVLSIAQSDAKLRTFLLSWDYTSPALWVVLLSYLGLLAPYTADQAVVQRYLTTPDEKQARRSVWTNAALSVPATVIFFSLGTALFAFYKMHPERLNPSLQTDAILPWFIAQQLPAGVSGLVIAGLFAAAMSTLDSSLNSVATTITTDFFRRFLPHVSDRSWLRLARVLTLLLGIIGTGVALFMATADVKSLWDQWMKILGLFGGGLAGLFVLGIFTGRAHGIGAVVGAVTSAVVLYLFQKYTHAHLFLYGTVGVTACVIVGYVASVVIPGERRSLEGLTLFTLKRPRQGPNAAKQPGFL